MPEYVVEKGVILERRQVTKSELRERFEELSMEEQACVFQLAEIRARKATLKALLESAAVVAVKE